MMQFAALFNEMTTTGAEVFAKFLNTATSSQTKLTGQWLHSATSAEVRKAATLLNEGDLEGFKKHIGIGKGFWSWLFGKQQTATSNQYQVRSVSTEWSGVFSELTSEESSRKAKPQLWLCCQKKSMAVALLTKLPAAGSALLVNPGELVEFSDGQAAAVFHVGSGRDILKLVKAICSGNFGMDKPIVNSGASVFAPSEDVRRILQIFGRGEALSIGNVAQW